MRVSDYFNCGRWPQFIVNILNVAFLPIFFNQIEISSAFWWYTASKKNSGSAFGTPNWTQIGTCPNVDTSQYEWPPYCLIYAVVELDLSASHALPSQILRVAKYVSTLK
jgi:hypothetical protein